MNNLKSARHAKQVSNKLIILLVLVFLISLVSAIPQTFNIHTPIPKGAREGINGKLTDSSGNALSGTYNMTFKIYDDRKIYKEEKSNNIVILPGDLLRLPDDCFINIIFLFIALTSEKRRIGIFLNDLNIAGKGIL
ncbi:MAG: hypothetical protein KJ646_05735 [Nanoarchaeota archaeon]|nr:hypothetical protein [Nanoarchaeota archaeon]MBU4116320.1 hypothetical protein [Nanoarchaeota archaeon]